MDRFSGLEDKPGANVYETLNGVLRLQLIHRDIVDFFPEFASSTLTVLDVGGCAGHFARICAEYGHRVVLCDSSRTRLLGLADELQAQSWPGSLEVRKVDFHAADCRLGQQFDLVAMHGSAEWVADPEQAITKAQRYVKPGGCLSLLVFNRDRQLLERGINGQLVQPPRLLKGVMARKGHAPPGARSAAGVVEHLDVRAGRLLLQSGIRVFHGFFRNIEEPLLSPRQWLEQEVRYYRQPPFSSFGVHTHFVWQAAQEQVAG